MISTGPRRLTTHSDSTITTPRESKIVGKETLLVRLILLGYDGSHAKTTVERPGREWPPARQHVSRYYLDAATGSLAATKPTSAVTATHEGHSLTASSVLLQIMTFFACIHTNIACRLSRILNYSSTKYTELCGRHSWSYTCLALPSMTLTLPFRSAKSLRLGIFLTLWSRLLCASLNRRCRTSMWRNIKHRGQQGMLRASHHVSLWRRGEDEVPVYDHRSRQPAAHGSIVPLLIPIWPVGMVFEAGEGLMLRVSSHDMSHPKWNQWGQLPHWWKRGSSYCLYWWWSWVLPCDSGNY